MNCFKKPALQPFQPRRLNIQPTRLSGIKAQSLTELATFGSVMLVVLSFFISYGMRYNYQQDVQMRTFRKAMQEAYDVNNSLYPRPDASASVVLLEDKHIPNPEDIFGIGNIVPAQSGAEIVWGNTMEDKHNGTDTTKLPRIKYVIKQGKDGTGKDVYYDEEYTTAGYCNFEGDYFYTDISGERVRINIENARIYKPQESAEPATQVMVLVDHGTQTNTDDETEIISAIAGLKEASLKQIIKVYPEGGKHGDVPTGFLLLDTSWGEINPAYMQLDNYVGDDAQGKPIYVTPGDIQGLLLDNEQKIKRQDELKITQEKLSEEVTNVTKYNMAGTTITHKIRDNTSEPEKKIDTAFSRQGGFK